MTITPAYATIEPARASVDALEGPTMLEFGTPWCGYCQAAQPILSEALTSHTGVRHLRIEDGPGRPLGRSYRIKLWPTLVFLRNGVEISRLVRPTDASDIHEALMQIDNIG